MTKLSILQKPAELYTNSVISVELDQNLAVLRAEFRLKLHENWKNITWKTKGDFL